MNLPAKVQGTNSRGGTGILVHMFLVGLPIALFTRRTLRGQ